MTPPAAATAPVRRPAAPHRAPLRGVPARPRRVSGPSARPAPRPASVIDAPFLDRLVHGRGWIAIVAVMLMGLVFLQVSLLKLNTGIGRAVTTAATLERQNAQLRGEVAKLDTGERIQAVASRAGMVMPGADRVNYLQARPGDGARAARSIREPSPVPLTPAATPGAATEAVQTGAAAPVAPTATAVPAATAAPAAAAQPQATAPAQTAPAQSAPAQQPVPHEHPPAGAAATGGAAPQSTPAAAPAP